MICARKPGDSARWCRAFRTSPSKKPLPTLFNPFPDGGREDLTYHPCHRIVLDLRTRIPDAALVVADESATSTYTLSLFNLAHGRRARTWGERVAAASDGDADTPWRRELDQCFAAALNGPLFSPTKTTMQLWDPWHHHRRGYRPILYQIVGAGGRRVGADAIPPASGRPLQVTIVIDPVVP